MNKPPAVPRSVLLAGAIAAAAVVWMLTGMVTKETPPQRTDDAAARSAPPETFPVTVRPSHARSITREILISGRTEPNRSVELSAETEGKVVRLGAERGRPVADGELIVALDMRDREAQRAQAEALVAERELQFEAAKQLEDRRLGSQAQIAEANAQLVSARSTLERVQLDIEHTRIVAPFDGVLEDRPVELGNYVGVGDPVATVVDIDPLIVAGDVSENQVEALNVGSPGKARLLGGEVVDGTIRYIAPVASQSTRTFRIELAIPNPDGRLRAGMTTELRLPAGQITAHQLSPALLTLADDGTIGVKSVDESDMVRFHAVQIVRSGADGVWVSGLPDDLRIISVGQGFVVHGQHVAPVVDPTMLERPPGSAQ